MPDRALQEALKAMEGLKGAESNGKRAVMLNELLEAVKTIMSEDEIDQDIASDLVKCFKSTAPAIYERVPRESLSLAAKTIVYIAENKLESAASPSSAAKSSFDFWEEVLDCGLISGLQAYQNSANCDKILLGEVVITPLANIWKSPLRSRLQLEFRMSLLTLLSDCVRRCRSNANLLLNPAVFGSHQFGLAIATAYESLISELLLELLVRTIHAAFGSSESTKRKGLWREVLQCGPMRAAFNPQVVRDLTAAAVSANNATFSTAMIEMQGLMAVDEARPQPFDASEIDVNGQIRLPSKQQRSLVLDQDSIILNTSDQHGSTESFIIRYVTIKQIWIKTDEHSVEVVLQLAAPPKLLFEGDISKSTNGASIVLKVPSDNEMRLRNGLRARGQTSKVVPGDSRPHIKQPRSSKTDVIQFLPKFRPSSQAAASSTEERVQEIVLKANFESSDTGMENLATSTNTTPAVFSQQSPHLQHSCHSQESKAQTLLPSIVDCTSDDTLSKAPSSPLSSPEPRPIPAAHPIHADNSLVSNALSHTEHTTTLERHANKPQRSEPLREARSYKRRKIECTTNTENAVEQSPRSTQHSARRTRRTTNTYKGKRKSPRLSSPGYIDGDNTPSDQIDLPADQNSKQQIERPKPKPKKRGRPPRRNATSREGYAPQSKSSIYDQKTDTALNSVSSLAQPTRRILSDLEPALAQSIARNSLHSPAVRKTLHPDISQMKSNQVPLKNPKISIAHEKRNLPIPSTHANPTSHHEPLSNSDIPGSPATFDDVTLVHDGLPGAHEVSVDAEPTTKAQSETDTAKLKHNLLRIHSPSGEELAPPRPRSPAKAMRAKGGIADRIFANYVSSSPTPGSREERGVLSLKRGQVAKALSQQAETTEDDGMKSSHPPQEMRTSTARLQSHLSDTLIIKEIVANSTFKQSEDNATREVWRGQQTPIRNRPRPPSSSPLLASAMKSTSKAGVAPRPRFSVSFADDVATSDLHAATGNAVRQIPPARADYSRGIELPSLRSARWGHPVDGSTAPSMTCVDYVDADWADNVLKILNSISEAVIESKRNEFRSIRHEVLVSRDAIINDMQLEVRREAEICARHCTQFLRLNSDYDAIGDRTKKAFRELSSQNTSISNQLQGTIRNHNSLTLSAKMRTHVFKNRVLGPTFAACRVSLAE